LPDTFLIDRKGNLIAAYHGVVDRDAVEASIQSLLVAKH
jgi:glutathione peroxidase-family protein